MTVYIYIYSIRVSERSAVIKHLSEDLYGKSMKIHGHEQFDCWLVVGTFFIFPYTGNVIIPTDFHIFQRVAQPPTRLGLYSFK